MDETGNAISSYVKHNLQCDDTFRDSKKRELILTRVEKAFSFLPEDVSGPLLVRLQDIGNGHSS